MSTKITFHSEPARNPETGAVVPFDWHVTMFLNGEPFISVDRSETSECRKSATERAAAFILAHHAKYHPSVSDQVRDAAENILAQFERVEWVR